MGKILYSSVVNHAESQLFQDKEGLFGGGQVGWMQSLFRRTEDWTTWREREEGENGTD